MPKVGETILAQLGGQRFIAMTGAKGFVFGDSYLMFSVPGRRINKIMISLTPRDTYRVEGLKYSPKNLTCTPVDAVEEVMVDNLQAVFTRLTGLDTHL